MCVCVHVVLPHHHLRLTKRDAMTHMRAGDLRRWFGSHYHQISARKSARWKCNLHRVFALVRKYPLTGQKDYYHVSY